MIAWKRTTWILWSGVLLCGASYTMAVSFLPLFLLELGVEAGRIQLWAGLAHAAAYATSAAMAPLWGRMVDRYGRRRMIVRAGVSLAVVYVLMAMAQNHWQLIAIRLVHGLAAGFVPASMAIAASVAPPGRLGWSMGLMQSGSLIGAVMGPLLGGGLSLVIGIRPFFLLSAGLILASMLIVLLGVKEEKADPLTRSRTENPAEPVNRANSQTMLYALGVLFLLQCSVNMILPQLPLHIAKMQDHLSSPIFATGAILAFVGLAGMIASPVWGKHGERYGHDRILLANLLIAGALLGCQFFSNQLAWFAVVQVLFGMFMAGIASAATIFAVRSISGQGQGTGFGYVASANNLGAMIGPIVGGVIGMFAGIPTIFWVAGLTLILAAALIPGLRRTVRSRGKDS